MKKPSATGQLSYGSRAPKFKKEKKKLDKGSRFLFYFVTALLPWIQLSSEGKRFSANEMTEEIDLLAYFCSLKNEVYMKNGQKGVYLKKKQK